LLLIDFGINDDAEGLFRELEIIDGVLFRELENVDCDGLLIALDIFEGRLFMDMLSVLIEGTLFIELENADSIFLEDNDGAKLLFVIGDDILSNDRMIVNDDAEPFKAELIGETDMEKVFNEVIDVTLELLGRVTIERMLGATVRRDRLMVFP
jgi:hypothetical protein